VASRVAGVNLGMYGRLQKLGARRKVGGLGRLLIGAAAVGRRARRANPASVEWRLPISEDCTIACTCAPADRFQPKLSMASRSIPL
jgi:hypothetical protein